jgi:hypothetical protein
VIITSRTKIVDRKKALVLIAAAASLLIGCVAAASGERSMVSERRTEIIKWRPFTNDGQLKPSLELRGVSNGGCEVGSPKIGDIGYRCGYDNYILNTCWRDGPGRTDYVVCVDPPWAKSAKRVHVPHLLLRAGFTYGPASTYPWGVVLEDGSRCFLLTGALGGVSVNGKSYTVDFSCSHDRYLLRNLRRGSIWKIGEVTYANNHYRNYKNVSIRRVYLGSLPAPMARQNALASQARVAASRIIRKRPAFRAIDKYPDSIHWVRLTIPDGRWARVKLENSNSQVWDVLLQRVNSRWTEVPESARSCGRLTADIRRQLGFRC